MPGGIRFGQYVLLRRIARGGMAEVFLAQQKGLEGFDRRVAVKRILPHLVDSPDFVKMFLGEAKLAAQLTHPNVVHIYDFGKVGGDYFIAMEYVEGIHAGQLWKMGEKGSPAGARMSPTLVARLGADAAAALHYAHELRGPNGKPLGLVHRDVSPANLMVSFDGVVKLCDFGIAKAAALSDQLTNPGQVKGKYAYMSPEQTIAAPLDGRSDVFSLAIVLWELLSGKTIVGRHDAVDSMRAIRDGKLEPIASAAPGTPQALADAITWALETKRDRRATAAELAQALEAFIKSSPELATPMQLAAWVRGRFTRDSTGEHRVVSSGDGTAAVLGTAAAPGTLAGPISVEVPRGGGRLIAASRMSQAEADELLDGAETVALDPDAVAARASQAPLVRQPMGEEESTIKAGPLQLAQTAESRRPQGRSARRVEQQDPTAQLDLADLEEADEDFREQTTSRKEPRRAGASGPQLAPARFEVPSLARAPASPAAPPHAVTMTDPGTRASAAPPPARRAIEPHRHSAALPDGGEPRQSTPAVPRRPATRLAMSIAVLLAIGVASFLIALAARSRGHAAGAPDAGVVPRDASALSVVPMTPDARVVAVDAPPPPPPPPPPPVDAAVVAIDAPAAPPAVPPATLDLATTPAGASVTVGDQVVTAPASLTLPAGHYAVTAELRGYAAEHRELDLAGSDRVALEIGFAHKGAGAHVAAPGKLSVKTTPASEVLTAAGASLGQTPLPDAELAAGSYLLTFRSPGHADVTRRVTIVAGKLTKVQLSLP